MCEDSGNGTGWQPYQVVLPHLLRAVLRTLGFGFDLHTKQVRALSIRPDLELVLVGHLKSHHVCTDSYILCEITGGIHNLVALVCFLYCFAFFSAVYYCGSDVFTKTKQPFIFMVWFFFFRLTCWKLSWLKNVDSFSGANTDSCPPVRALVFWWKWILWVSVTDYSVTVIES